MKKIVLIAMMALAFIGCSAKSEDSPAVKPKLVVGQELSFTLNDQFEKPHSLNANTYKVLFAFSKDAAHVCNDFFNTQEADYLEKHNAQFIADVSAAPSLIRSLFIFPGLKDFKHTVLLLDDEDVAAPYRADVDVEKIIVVYVINGTITDVKTISTEAEVKNVIEDDSAMSVIAPLINKVMK